MSDMDKDNSLESDKAVEALLGRATPRPVPPESEAQSIRMAVNDEWKKVVRQKRNNRTLKTLAMAASVILAVFVALNFLQTSGVEEVQIATIGKEFGSFYVYGENSEQLAGNELTVIVAGETLRTSANSGLGVDWGRGGSLRIDENTTVQFVSEDTIYLRSGRVYVDSTPGHGADDTNAGNVPKLKIETAHGVVTHVGTQYMTFADADRLVVSVRSGEVRVESSGGTGWASSGQQLISKGRGRPGFGGTVKTWGEAWQWIEEISPAVRLNDQPVSKFLEWVSHETGFDLEYVSDGAETHAETKTLKGPVTVNSAPREALNFWVSGVDLDWRIDDENGVIYVDKPQ